MRRTGGISELLATTLLPLFVANVRPYVSQLKRRRRCDDDALRSVRTNELAICRLLDRPFLLLDGEPDAELDAAAGA